MLSKYAVKSHSISGYNLMKPPPFNQREGRSKSHCGGAGAATAAAVAANHQSSSSSRPSAGHEDSGKSKKTSEAKQLLTSGRRPR